MKAADRTHPALPTPSVLRDHDAAIRELANLWLIAPPLPMSPTQKTKIGRTGTTITSIIGIVLVFGSQQIVTWVQDLFGV